ncbi:MAG TPA: hypothetical protein DCZ94_21875 [Lentisphaeria bacterium]|nr:MAG: hypothetical protein A2X48_19280 [Lentisphaerae bacterium GWF2_49_21]HBC89595.1 hypothetical protein [Lentisphaeria bacterium]
MAAILGMLFIPGLLSAESVPAKVLSLTQYGITWTFASPAESGCFITGDYWVVGPVTVKSVSPEPATGRNGSVVNPIAGDKQGYDDRAHWYDAGFRATFPLELKPGQSLVSTASLEKVGDKTPDTVEGQGLRGPLRTAVVLTCLLKAPPADAFRPAYVGTWKDIFTASSVKRSLLPGLAAPNPKLVSDVKGLERQLERIWLDHQKQWVNREMHPLENMPDYGREITNVVSNTALVLMLDDPERENNTLLLRFIQKGIDYYGTVRSNDDLWVANGGHNSGRKWPIIFAGLMLGHDGMAKVKATFQEDQQTYYGKGFKGQKVLWTIAPDGANVKHEESNPDKWESFGQGANNGSKAESYRRLNGPTWGGEALAARLMGALELWNHQEFFEYVDRWCDEEKPKFSNPFVVSMWNAYRAKADEFGRTSSNRRREK